ncbi:MAG: LysM domain-containing protein, partial [Pseudomonadota bacterium]
IFESYYSNGLIKTFFWRNANLIFETRINMERNVSQDKGDAAQEFMREVVNDLGYAPKSEKNQQARGSIDLRPNSRFLIPGIIGILLLITVSAFFFLDQREVSKKDIASIQTGLNRLEERLDRLDLLEERIARLEAEEKRLLQSLKNMARGNLNAEKKKASSQAKNRYHTVRPGESLYSIAKKYDVSTDELCRLNKIAPKKAIQPGQKILIGQ